jgi:hypothetical protein
MHILAAATPPTSWATAGTIAVAVVGGIATVVAGFLAYRSTRTATAMTTQSTAQTATLESVDRRIGEAFDAKDADREYLLAELGRRSEQEEILRARLAVLEASFSAYKDQTDARIRDQGDRINTLSGEVNSLRNADAAWKRWSGQALLMYATLVERLHRANGEASPELPPTPPLE